jgi:cytoskeletal protein CcmA (bactofilin family)
MEQENRLNLLISGIGSSNGGTVRLAKIDGLGKVDGDISCSKFIVNGRAEVHGSIKSSAAEIHGTVIVDGSLHADRIRIHGKISVYGDIIGDTIQLNGTISVNGKCETEQFEASGRFQMGMLNAGNIQISLHGNSRIAEIGGEYIKIRKQPGIDFAKWLKVLPIPLANSNRLTAQSIEGNDIYVEYTTAEVVRGTNVTIGPGCEIGLVEYNKKFEQDKGSTVKSFEQI